MTQTRPLLVEQDAIDSFPVGTQAILNAVGHPDALVTDLSQVWDFCSHDPDHPDEQVREQAMFAELTALAGRPVDRNDYLWELARDIERLRQAPTRH